LAEIGLCLIHGFMKGLVVPRSLNGTLNFISAGTGAAKDTSKQIARGTQGAAGIARHRGFERRHESTSAAIAEEFELISFVGGMVSMISGELNQGHEESPLTVFLWNWVQANEAL
jgi:hypothetical protein